MKPATWLVPHSNRTLVVTGSDAEMGFFTMPGLAPAGQQSADLRWFTFPGRISQLTAAACQLAGKDISATVWQRLVGDQPYRSVCPPTR